MHCISAKNGRCGLLRFFRRNRAKPILQVTVLYCTVGSEIGFTLELNDFKVALHLTNALVLLRLKMFEPLHHPCSLRSHVRSGGSG